MWRRPCAALLCRRAGAGASAARAPSAALSRRLARWPAVRTIVSDDVLTAEHKQLVNAQRQGLVGLQTQLAAIQADEEDLELMAQTVAHLDELFLLCIVGEFNAGKSSLINALLGKRHLREGVTPTTDRVYLIKHKGAGERGAVAGAISAHGHPPPTTLELPVPWLEDVTLVDTPGTNAIIAAHAEITEAIVPRCDLLLFVTSTDRPISESERVFMKKITEWGKKVVVVLNKADMLEESNGAEPGDMEQVLSFVRSAAAEALGTQKLQVFPVCARGALRAKEGEGDVEEEGLGFAALERYILETLRGPERLQMKLENPVGVASTLANKYDKVLAARLAVVESDKKIVGQIERDLETYSRDMEADFKLQKSRVQTVLMEMAVRADAFFEEELVLTNLPSLLMNKDALRLRFEERVLADTTGQVDQQVRDLVDWMVGKTQRQAANVLDFLHARVVAQDRLMVGTVGRTFESNRAELVETLQGEALRVVATYDSKAEAKKLSQQVRGTLYATMGLETAALATVGGMVSLAAFDLSGMAMLGVGAGLGIGGLALLPFQQARLKANFRGDVVTLRDSLDNALGEHLSKSLEESVVKIQESYAPFDRSVRADGTAIVGQRAKLKETVRELRAGLQSIRVVGEE